MASSSLGRVAAYAFVFATVAAACGNSVTVIGGTSGGGGTSATNTGSSSVVTTTSTVTPDTGPTTVTTGPMVCVPGQVVKCNCADGGVGAQVCAMDGSGFGPCACDQPGGDPDACVNCAQGIFQMNPCAGTVDKCLGDPACQGWLHCTQQCFEQDWSVSCWRGCDKKFAGGKALWSPIYNCLCTPCAGPCSPAC
jgi:hypothetical protein